MRILIKNGNVVLRNALLKNASVLIESAGIKAVGRNIAAGKTILVIDAKGSFVSPGFIDTHIHGEPAKIFSNEVRFGTTSIVTAISCDKLYRIYGKIAKIKEFIGENPFGRNVLGVRLEGPYINKNMAGAQDKRYIKGADEKELRRIIKDCKGLLKIMTLAPELEGAIGLIKMLCKEGIIASVGHSDATYEEAAAGIRAGISHATHIFNAMSGVHKAYLGAAEAAILEDSVRTEIILDFIHVNRGLFDLLIAVKGVDKTILVTDSVRAEAKGQIRKMGGVYRFNDGRIAGSSITMIEAVENAIKTAGLSLLDAVRLATLNPARLLGLENKKGSIAAGMDADVVIFDKDFDVKTTIINGEIVYKKQ